MTEVLPIIHRSNHDDARSPLDVYAHQLFSWPFDAAVVQPKVVDRHLDTALQTVGSVCTIAGVFLTKTVRSDYFPDRYITTLTFNGPKSPEGESTSRMVRLEEQEAQSRLVPYLLGTFVESEIIITQAEKSMSSALLRKIITVETPLDKIDNKKGFVRGQIIGLKHIGKTEDVASVDIAINGNKKNILTVPADRMPQSSTDSPPMLKYKEPPDTSPRLNDVLGVRIMDFDANGPILQWPFLLFRNEVEIPKKQ